MNIQAVQQGSDRDETMADLLAYGLHNSPDKMALSDGLRGMSFHELDAFSLALARYLVSIGLQREDRVALVAR